MREFTLSELEEMDNLCEGQADALKYEDEKYRVWLSRCTVDDGEPYNNKVTVEMLNEDYCWEVVDEYQAL